MDRYQEVVSLYPMVRCSSPDLEACSVSHTNDSKQLRKPLNWKGTTDSLSAERLIGHVGSRKTLSLFASDYEYYDFEIKTGSCEAHSYESEDSMDPSRYQSL